MRGRRVSMGFSGGVWVRVELGVGAVKWCWGEVEGLG